jgi:glycosyltransferase involved in cell wall biosynthesis
MRLAILTPVVKKGDGQGRANYEIAYEAARRGHDVHIVADAVDEALAAHPRVHYDRIAVSGLPTEMVRSNVMRLGMTRWLARHADSMDLVQTYGSVVGGVADISTAQFVHDGWWRCRAHIWRQEKTPYSLYQAAYTNLNRWLERPSFKRARHLIAVSHQIKDELVHLGAKSENISVIFNGADIDEFHPGPGDRARFGLPEGRTIALFAGDIRLNRKNLDSVLLAMTGVKDLCLAVAGSVARSPYPAMAKALGLEDRVFFLDKRKDLNELMRACDFFVFPSRYEGFALVVMEALASGLPVVVTRTTGAAEVVTPDAGFVLEDPEDVVSLRTAMQKLAPDAQLRRDMGAAARRIAERHSWRSKAEEYVDLFERIVARKAASSPVPFGIRASA